MIIKLKHPFRYLFGRASKVEIESISLSETINQCVLRVNWHTYNFFVTQENCEQSKIDARFRLVEASELIKNYSGQERLYYFYLSEMRIARSQLDAIYIFENPNINIPN